MASAGRSGLGAWARAREIASRTPEGRNRYVDFLRAASIVVVVVGHWLMAAPFFEHGALRLGDMLHLAPWSQWLTWAFQVMPVFFIVGGYSNAASWEAAQRTGLGYDAWIGARLQRLVAPLVPFLLLWAGMAAAAHQLGYAWRAGSLAGPARGLPLAAGGLALLIALVVAADYPVSMISVPGEEVSNSRPPTLALLALGTFQLGLLLSIEAPARRWLRLPTPWSATVLVNGTIMTLYLWHLTVMVLVIGLLNLLGGAGLGPVPGSGAWWLTRPLWLLALAAGLGVCLALFFRFEQRSRAEPAGPLPAWRSVFGAAALCGGIALLALGGIGGGGPLGLRLGVLLPIFAGMALVLGAPTRRAARRGGSSPS